MGANPFVLSVSNSVAYESDASIRIDVPDASDPDGGFAGAAFIIDGSGRNLTEYDALTFWAQATQGATIGTIGFGSEFRAAVEDINFTTGWTKYVIPIPDPSKLTNVSTVFEFSAGGIGPEGEEKGYTFWIDELKFERLGTLAQARPSILNGEQDTVKTFIGVDQVITNLTQTFNLANGQNQTVTATPGYFDFFSSNGAVARVNEMGEVEVIGVGTAEITAILNGVKAEGSLTIISQGEFVTATPPTRDAANVISVFSDVYTNVAVDYYNGFFNGDGQTTQGGTGPGGADIIVNGDGIINYTDLNFVGIGTFTNVPSIDASEMTHLHVDIQVQETVESGDYIDLTLLNSVGVGETSGTTRIADTQLASNAWVSLDIPLADFGLADQSKLGLLFFISDNTISNILVDNIYYYK